MQIYRIRCADSSQQSCSARQKPEGPCCGSLERASTVEHTTHVDAAACIARHAATGMDDLHLVAHLC
ncbi:hypothetical protein BDP81DRAFT_415555, partial [Colletotrichum phormii]